MTPRQLLNLLREVRLRRLGDTAYRAYHATLQRLGLLQWKFPTVTPCEGDLIRALRPGIARDIEQFVAHFDQRREPAFYDLPDSTVAAGSSQAKELIRRADLICEGRFQILGGGEIHFPRDVDWSHSLSTDGRWPVGHWADIDFRTGVTGGDVKTCWEFNRHHDFVILGRAYRQTSDEKYVDRFVQLLESWCDQNPPEMGVHYASNLEIGLRCVSWLWAHHLMAPSPRYAAHSRGRLHLFIYYMARHLAANLKYTLHTGRNNHLVGDASCLAMIALMYPELQAAEAWRRRALDILWRTIDEQVLPDGMHFELSFGYHQFVAECYLQVIRLMQRQNLPVPPKVLARVKQMLDVVVIARQPDGELPNFNDCDEGRGDLRCAMEDVRCEERTEWRQDKSIEPKSSVHSLHHAGLYIMRGDNHDRPDFALVNNHPDPFPNSGHNHASLLQLLLWIDGAPVLIDGGTFRYNGDETLRNSLRGTAAHNTVVVDDANQARPHRNFGWLDRLRPGRSEFIDTEEYATFDGYHDCYQRLREPVRHRRTVVWLKRLRAWIVRDELTGQRPGHRRASVRHQFRQMWHFPAVRCLQEVAPGYFESRLASHATVGIQLQCHPGDEVQIDTGSPEHPWSWESPRYGELRPRTSLGLTWEAAVPTQRVAAFFDTRATPCRQGFVEQLSDTHLRIAQGQYDLYFKPSGVRCVGGVVDPSASQPEHSLQSAGLAPDQLITN